MNRIVFAGLVALLTIQAGLASPAASSRQDIASGGIGLTRTAWEAEHGPGERVDSSVPVFGELYAYEEGAYHVALEGSKTEADDVVMYIEVAFGEEGVPFDQARETAEGLLPSDAAFRESYYAPPTPGGPIALNSILYTSAALDAVPYGTDTLTPNVMVTYHMRIETIDTGHQVVHEEHVVRVGIMAQIPPG